jgi:alpha/beta superfamily hydrolase
MSKLRVQFIHGLESSPQSTKAGVLAEHFVSSTPGMQTDDFEGCVAQQYREIGTFEPEVLVASSFGGAVAVALLQRGLWQGPTLLLAQAALRQGQACELPEDVVVWLVHGTRDEIVDPEDSRSLAACGSKEWVRLIEVDDDHVLKASVGDGSLVRWVREIAAVR